MQNDGQRQVCIVAQFAASQAGTVQHRVQQQPDQCHVQAEQVHGLRSAPDQLFQKSGKKIADRQQQDSPATERRDDFRDQKQYDHADEHDHDDSIERLRHGM